METKTPVFEEKTGVFLERLRSRLSTRDANVIIGDMKTSKAYLALLLGGITGLLAACGAESLVPPTPAWTPLPLTSNVPLATATTAPTQAVPPANPSGCIDDAAFLEDLTIPDQTVVTGGDNLDKRWAIQNSGSCDWGAGYRLARVGNDSFGSIDEIALFPARAGSAAVWQVLLTAPFQPGEHISIWQARSPEGAFFGEQVYLWVVVATPTPVPTSRGTPTN